MNNNIYVLIFIFGLFFTGQCAAQGDITDPAASASAGTPAPLADFRSLDQETELLVKEVLDLSSDLAILQEEEDNPANYQLQVLVTLDPTKLFALDYIQLEVDNEVVAAYQYSERDLQALSRGAGHRLYVANFPAGMHALSLRNMLQGGRGLYIVGVKGAGFEKRFGALHLGR